jgi:Protein of unknown function
VITDEEIDEALLANVIHRWRKVARVVGSAMSQLGDKRRGRDDLYFAQRVSSLVQRGLIEAEGDLNRWVVVKLDYPGARTMPNQPLEATRLSRRASRVHEWPGGSAPRR